MQPKQRLDTMRGLTKLMPQMLLTKRMPLLLAQQQCEPASANAAKYVLVYSMY